MKNHKKEYRNLTTGEVTNDMEVAKSWYDKGEDYAIWHYSYVFEEMIELATVSH